MDDRRREDEEPLTPTHRHSNVFSDEYEVLDMSVSDGFRRPSTSSDNDNIYSAAAHYADNPVMSFSPEPQQNRSNSTRKSRSYDNPFASAEDASLSLTRTPSIASTTQYAPGIARRISSASSNMYAGTSSPRTGAAGPSHPYTMYPQGTIARTPSVATSSAQPRRQSSLRNGPAHPYGMYTQGIGGESDEEDEETALNPVPVGFGLNQTYRRVRGPEGEEQDIIGEYGHAEQLPPYSRYPEDGPEKAPILAVPEGLHTRAPVEGTDPGMPLMHQQISRQSMTDASTLEQAEPLLADQNDGVSSTEASTLGKKSWAEKNWKEKRRTKIICGIPFGWILITFCVVGFIFAILVGSLVGYLAGKKDRGSPPVIAASSTTSLYDASVIATPTNAPATGTFALSLGTPQATQADCLVNSNQRVAWDCNLVGKPALAMTVGLPAQATPSIGARVYYASDDTNLSYGAQIQDIQSQFSNLIPVQDNDDPALGPAFFFQSVYDKIVVLPEDTFTPSKAKRQYNPQPNWDSFKNHKAFTRVATGEKPWFCFFNNTAIEGFIYVQRPAQFNYSTMTTSASSTITSPPSSYSYDPGAGASQQAAWQSYMSAAQAARTTSIAGVQPRSDKHYEGFSWGQMYLYPYLVKLEERRLPNNTISAYCQQYQMLDNGVYNPFPGQPLNFLEENDPSWSVYASAGVGSTSSKRAIIPGGCHCQWIHGAPP